MNRRMARLEELLSVDLKVRHLAKAQSGLHGQELVAIDKS